MSAGLLERLFLSQAYRELGAARLFEAGAALAPDRRAHDEICAQAREEREHLGAVIALWSELAGRDRAALERVVAARLDERPLPTPGAWLDLAMARLLYDRAGHWQLREYQDCSCRPYAALARRILGEETRHQESGARAVVDLCRAAASEAQATFARWLRPALLSFGRPGSAASAQAIALGLKRRDPGAVMQDFVDDVRPIIVAAGLTWPVPETLDLQLPPALRW